VTAKQFATIVAFWFKIFRITPLYLGNTELGFWVPTFVVGPLPTHSTFSWVSMEGIVLSKRLGLK
jgi:hypothetical protein